MSTGPENMNEKAVPVERKGWRRLLLTRRKAIESEDSSLNSDKERPPEKWSMGILNDKKTEEVPGTILLLSAQRNEPLGLRHAPAHHSASSLPSPYPSSSSRPGSIKSSRSAVSEKKRTPDGQILLEPQPDDSLNDPLNWASWRRDLALLSLGFYCMLGGGLTPVLAAGFQNVADDYGVTYARVALTTGFYMMGMGVGCVIFSPTAILFGKRPVYLGGAILLIVTSIWCAASPSYASLAAARVFQGIAVSPVECLPSASIAEIFFLHERAFRIGIYTLLLLGGKNLVPLASAAVINSMGWPWVFWIYAIVVGFGGALLFLFVPETFWDRTPRPKKKRPHPKRSLSNLFHSKLSLHEDQLRTPLHEPKSSPYEGMTPRQEKLHRHNLHVGFAEANAEEPQEKVQNQGRDSNYFPTSKAANPAEARPVQPGHDNQLKEDETAKKSAHSNGGNQDEIEPIVNVTTPEGLEKPEEYNISTQESEKVHQPSHTDNSSDTKSPTKPQLTIPGERKPGNLSLGKLPSFAETLNAQNQHGDNSKLTRPDTLHKLPDLRSFNSPYYLEIERNADYLTHHKNPSAPDRTQINESPNTERRSSLDRGKSSPLDANFEPSSQRTFTDIEHGITTPLSQKSFEVPQGPMRYTTDLRQRPPKTFAQTLKPWNGRLNRSHWFKVMLRPFLLFLYPSVLWSALVYSLSIGWLIVLSESVSSIYRNKESYNFSALGTGLVYISPFIGGVLGTAVAGRVSDIIIRYLSRRNGGVYEPEFRLVMAIPVAISTAIGLMGFGWSASERDAWIVPTVFFGIISFGCSLGSTTAITFCVDSYRQYAGEALVTLNFSKNIFHGLVFSLFFADWLESEGPKKTFLAIGGIQVACLLSTVPMYVYGKRARMWTVRCNWMEKL